MRFLKYIEEGEYISLVEKKDYIQPKDKEKNRILKDLNILLDGIDKSKKFKFSISKELISPSEILTNIEEKKKEKLTRLWMIKSEQLEEIKETKK